MEEVRKDELWQATQERVHGTVFMEIIRQAQDDWCDEMEQRYRDDFPSNYGEEWSKEAEERIMAEEWEQMRERNDADEEWMDWDGAANGVGEDAYGPWVPEPLWDQPNWAEEGRRPRRSG